MKNKIKFTLFVMFFISSCQGINEENQSSESSQYSTYLDVSEDLRSVEVTDLSIADEKIYLEARNRFDKIVTYDNGQFYIGQQSSEQLNISEELYQHFCKLVKLTNGDIKKFTKEGIAVIEEQDFKRLNVKTRSESSGGGIDDFRFYWYGFDVYLSMRSMAYIAAGGSAVSVICGIIPDPSLATKVAGAACGLTGVLAGLGVSLYPNGVIISFTYPFTGTCIPYYISGQ